MFCLKMRFYWRVPVRHLGLGAELRSVRLGRALLAHDRHAHVLRGSARHHVVRVRLVRLARGQWRRHTTPRSAQRSATSRRFRQIGFLRGLHQDHRSSRRQCRR